MASIHIASLGTLLALVLALPVGVLAAHNLVPFTPVNLFAKLILVSSRSVNSLVWALLFVGIFGPGALAVEAAEVMERMRISQLLVIGDDGQLEGALTTHDLMLAKVI